MKRPIVVGIMFSAACVIPNPGSAVTIPAGPAVPYPFVLPNGQRPSANFDEFHIGESSNGRMLTVYGISSQPYKFLSLRKTVAGTRSRTIYTQKWLASRRAQVANAASGPGIADNGNAVFGLELLGRDGFARPTGGVWIKRRSQSLPSQLSRTGQSPDISANGRYAVAFGPSPSNGNPKCLTLMRINIATRVASRGCVRGVADVDETSLFRVPRGDYPRFNQPRASISADGRFSLVWSDATNIVAETRGKPRAYRLFRYDWATASAQLVASDATMLAAMRRNPFISRLPSTIDELDAAGVWYKHTANMDTVYLQVGQSYVVRREMAAADAEEILWSPEGTTTSWIGVHPSASGSMVMFEDIGTISGLNRCWIATMTKGSVIPSSYTQCPMSPARDGLWSLARSGKWIYFIGQVAGSGPYAKRLFVSRRVVP